MITKKVIYADALISALRDDPAINGANLRRVVQHINDAPAVDTVVHGRWKQAKYTEAPLYICSECYKPEYKQHNYCPNCGAKMDGGKVNET